MRLRSIVILLVVTLVSTACGARLTDDERAAGIRAVAGAGDADDGSGGADSVGSDLFDGTGAGGSQAGVLGGGSTGSSSGGSAGGTGGTTGGGTGGTTGGGTGGSTGGGTGGGSTAAGDQCTPGGESDVGVRGDRIVIATISDVTGPVPGLFKSTHQAVQAYAAKVNSEGGICGRGLEVKLYDSKSDSGENRAAVLEACDEAFALVGSMSAFDDAGAAAVDECQIPEISSTVTSTQRIDAEWVYPGFPNNPSHLATGNATYIAEQYPDAVQNAAILWLNAAVTRNNAAARKTAWEDAGFNFIYTREVQVLEANYTPFILQMEDAGVEYVTFVGDNANIARLMKAAKQQNWAPTVWDWDSVAYDQKFLDQAGDAANGANVFIATAMFEEAGGNPEMQEYLQWLGRVAPGAKPDYFGELAWSAAALFVEKMRGLGGEPTRENLRAALQAQGEWDGHGMHGPHQIGPKIPTKCFLIMEVRELQFVRVHPSQPNTWDCSRGRHVDAR